MQYSYFPIALDQLGATIRYHDLVEGTFEIDDIKVTARYLNHPALTLGYRLEADGATVVYASDHEPYSRALAKGLGEITGQDLRHADFIKGADLLIHDAQFTASEYKSKVNWGHSPVEYAARLGRHAQVRRLALTHHDPSRTDEALDRVLVGVRAGLRENEFPLEIFAASDGQAIEVEPSYRGPMRPSGQFQALTPVEPALVERSVILGVADAGMAAELSEVIRAEGIRTKFFSDIGEVPKLLGEQPSLAVLEHDAARVDALDICRAIRREEGDRDDRLPVVVVAAREDASAGAAAGVTEWLTKPFTTSYARTKIRSWVLRTECQWIRAAFPDDEDRRMDSLRRLKILDTGPEERFDRITRLAAALFHVPIALVSLVDSDRQWFKSCIGTTIKETPRDQSLCAHVVHRREPIIVPDTFLDPRFADSPLVTNEPRIRFYAGVPLILDDGSCLGTLCLIDTRPRVLDSPELARLHDLAAMAARELQFMAAIR